MPLERKKVLKIAAVQMNSHETDKATNLGTIGRLSELAATKGADIISFPEICLTGYNFILYTKSKEKLLSVAEEIPGGKSFRRIREMSGSLRISILYGFLEKEGGALFNTYAAVRPDGTFEKYHKIHAFENSFISQGAEFRTFDLHGWKCGTLVCYDNNIPENSRAYMLKGCELLFSPHQTGGFDMDVAGMGRIDVKLWSNRKKDPSALRRECMGPKGREWIVKWFPSRSYDNGFYSVFTNGVGLDHDEVRTGNAMIVDPNGCIIAESRSTDTDMVLAEISKDKLEGTLARLHNKTRRPELYAEISKKRAGLTDTRSARNTMTRHSRIE